MATIDRRGGGLSFLLIGLPPFSRSFARALLARCMRRLR